jgi:hypothetical protein
MKATKILVIGACGQIGTEQTLALRERYGNEQVIAADSHALAEVPLNVLDLEALNTLVRAEEITQIYLLAAMLSARGESKSPFVRMIPLKIHTRPIFLYCTCDQTSTRPADLRHFDQCGKLLPVQDHRDRELCPVGQQSIAGSEAFPGDRRCHDEVRRGVREIPFSGIH